MPRINEQKEPNVNNIDKTSLPLSKAANLSSINSVSGIPDNMPDVDSHNFMKYMNNQQQHPLPNWVQENLSKEEYDEIENSVEGVDEKAKSVRNKKTKPVLPNNGKNMPVDIRHIYKW